MKPHVVVIGAGGGNDVFSCIAYIENTLATPQASYQCATPQASYLLVGMLGLTPFHYPEPIEDSNTYTEPMIIVSSVSMSRYIPCHPPKKIACMETHLAHLYPNSICMSTKYSIPEQTKALHSLLLERGMTPETTEIHLVDFGGDILSDGTEGSIISPELDAYSLALVESMMRLGYNASVYVCFPGVGGELSTKRLRHYLHRESVTREGIDKKAWHKSLSQILSHIKHERPGNTLPAMIGCLEGKYEFTLHKKWHVNDKTYLWTKEVELDKDMQVVYRVPLPIANPYKEAILEMGDNYCLDGLLNAVVDIYSKQECTENRAQSSDLFLQYLRDGGNKYLSLEDSMSCHRVDVRPHVIGKI